MTEKNDGDSPQGTRGLLTRGRALLAVGKYRKGEASMGISPSVSIAAVYQVAVSTGHALTRHICFMRTNDRCSQESWSLFPAPCARPGGGR